MMPLMRHLAARRLRSIQSPRNLRVMAGNVPDIALDEFAFRQFDDPKYAGTRIPPSVSKTEFMEKVLDYYGQRRAMEAEFDDRPTLVAGYAPFCKHIFMPNWIQGLTVPVVKITKENEHLMRTGYEARTEKELPVLSRYFPAGAVEAPPCTYLDLILYSRDQIVKENEATGKRSGELEASPWRLISIKAQAVPYETPMQPITVMRNALISEGGSGVPIDRKAYMASIDFWREHAPIA